jgi:hypothetical protein
VGATRWKRSNWPRAMNIYYMAYSPPDIPNKVRPGIVAGCPCISFCYYILYLVLFLLILFHWRDKNKCWCAAFAFALSLSRDSTVTGKWKIVYKKRNNINIISHSPEEKKEKKRWSVGPLSIYYLSYMYMNIFPQICLSIENQCSWWLRYFGASWKNREISFNYMTTANRFLCCWTIRFHPLYA